METIDQVLVFLKYGGSVATAAYGIYATLTDFHEQRNGRKVLSKRGYFGIGLLVLVGSQLIISFYRTYVARSAEQRSDLDEVRRALEFEYLNLAMSDGQQFESLGGI